MANAFDYLAWRGDLTLEQDAFSEVDGTILARLSYFPFEELTALPDALSVGDALEMLFSVPDLEKKVMEKGDLRLMHLLRDSPRFSSLQFSQFRYMVDEESQTQFSAITVKLTPNFHCIAFRGTDNALAGWKEDFNMGFVCPVPSQVIAVDYLENVANLLPGKFCLVGHSKGGNLAVYAGAFCSKAVQERLEQIYNLDGPGFQEEVLQTDGYREICSKVQTYVPQSSVVGMLLGHEEAYTIVHSTTAGILQHDVYSWEVVRRSFSYLETVDAGSMWIDSTLKAWIADLSQEQKEMFVETIYALLSKTQAKTLRELTENWFTNAMTILRSIGNLDPSTKKAVSDMLSSLVRFGIRMQRESGSAKPQVAK